MEQANEKRDRWGRDAQGFSRSGWRFSDRTHQATGTHYDPDGYDLEGYDRDGFTRRGWNRDGINRETGTIYDARGHIARGPGHKRAVSSVAVEPVEPVPADAPGHVDDTDDDEDAGGAVAYRPYDRLYADGWLAYVSR